MAVIDTIEGKLPTGVTFHYDVGNDVLYLQLGSEADADTYGDEEEPGLILLRRVSDDKPVGLTIPDWWSRFGDGSLPNSLAAITRHIEPHARSLAA